jgi:two-component system chemotaxis response regulator CheY
VKTAWFVDDDEEMVRVIQKMLKVLDYRTKTFHTARASAKVLLGGEQPDILIIDIHMPEVSGFELLKFVRDHHEWDTITILMLSSEVSEVQVDKATKLGADGYVFKPVTLDELEIVISMARENRAQEINKSKE